MALPAPRAERMSLLLARCAAVVVCAIGGIVLLGWQLPIAQLTQALTGLVSMTPDSAAGALAAGIGLFCITFRPLRPISRLIRFALVMFGLALLYAKQGRALSAFSQILALVILAQVLIVLAGYVYGVATYYYPFPFT